MRGARQMDGQLWAGDRESSPRSTNREDAGSLTQRFSGLTLPHWNRVDNGYPTIPRGTQKPRYG